MRRLRFLLSRGRVFGVARDEWSVQDAIRANRWLLDAMLEQFPDGAVNVFDRDLRFLYVAGTGLPRIGLRPEELIGHRLDELFPEIVAWVRPFFNRAFAGETVAFPLSVVGREYGIRAWPLAEVAGAITAVVAIAREAPVRPAAAVELTRRQREIATLVAAGLTNNQIAERLMLAPRTVRNYIGHILHRLNFVSRTQVAVWAAACGLYCPGEGDDIKLDGDPARQCP
jgi:DNA-binding CsgD family transcriptional regulator